METKTMKVSDLTHSRLQALGQKGDSFDMIIASLLDGNAMASASREMLRDPAFNAKMVVRRDLMKGIAIPAVDDITDPVSWCFMPSRGTRDIERTVYRNMAVFDGAETESECPPVVVADFDGEKDPYAKFRHFWKTGRKAAELALFFTDDRRGDIINKGSFIRPTGRRATVADVDRGSAYANYLAETVMPWFEKLIAPYTIVAKRIQCIGATYYWGVVIALQEDAKAGE